MIALARYAKDLRTDRSGAGAPRLVTVGDEVDQTRFVAREVLANREARA